MAITFNKDSQPERGFQLDKFENYSYEEAVEQAKEFEEFRATADENGKTQDGTFLADGSFQFNDGRITTEPITTFEVSIAMERAGRQLDRRTLFPACEDAFEKYPHINPEGHLCDVDMAMADRLLRIRTAADMAVGENKAFAQEAIEALYGNPKNNAFQRTYGKMLDRAFEFRQMDRASQMARTPEAFERIRENRDSLAVHAADVRACDGMLQGLETVLGLRQGPLSEAVADQYNRALAKPISQDLLDNAPRRIGPKNGLVVNFENLDGIARAVNMAKPENWDKKPQTVSDQLSPQETDRVIRNYATATVSAALDPVFDGFEATVGGDAHRTPNRASLITVDGKTVKEMITDRYAEMQQSKGLEVKAAEFADFYKKNHKQLTNEFVSAGMMAGKRVEMFTPDPVTGRLPKEPTQLVKKGYEPSPLKEVTMNGWERFFSRRGYYKEKTAQVAEYQRVMDARERVTNGFVGEMNQEHSSASYHVKDIYLKEGLAERGIESNIKITDGKKLPNPAKFRVDRSTLISACQGQLLLEGHEPEEVFDNTKLLAEKNALGKRCLEAVEAGDTKWMAEGLALGQEKVLEHLNRRVGDIEYTSYEALGTRAQVVRDLSATAFDMNQEIQKLAPDVLAVTQAKHPEMDADQAKAHYLNVNEKASTYAGISSIYNQGANARALRTKENLNPTERGACIQGLVQEKVAMKDISQYRAEHGGIAVQEVPFLVTNRTTAGSLMSAIAMGKDIQDLDAEGQRRVYKALDHPDFFEKSGYTLGMKESRYGPATLDVLRPDEGKIQKFVEGVSKKSEHIERANTKSTEGLQAKAAKQEAKTVKKDEGPTRKK